MTFIADKTLGKLVKWLRILGYDALYWRSEDQEGLLRRARDDGRVLVTKDTRLYKKRGSLEALLIREDNPFRQIRELVHHFRLPVGEAMLFSRCVTCNAPLDKVQPEEVKGVVPDYIYHTHQEFSRCPSCRKVYWAGTHYGHVSEAVRQLKEGAP